MLRNILIFPFVFFVVRFSISSHHETVLIWSERLEIIFQSVPSRQERVQQTRGRGRGQVKVFLGSALAQRRFHGRK